MRSLKHFAPVLAGLLFPVLVLSVGAAAQPAARADAGPPSGAQGRAVVTVLPSGKGPGSTQPLSAQQIRVRVDGKDSAVTGFRPLTDQNSPIELVFLIDPSAHTDLANQFGDIKNFTSELPSGSKVGVAYMQNGMARFSGPLTTDTSKALKGLTVSWGTPGQNGSPYFCLSDLAKRWPSNDPHARREVVLISDGVDNYNRRLDLEDPYVQNAIRDAVRARLVVFTIYWPNRGPFSHSMYETDAGQSLLNQVADATGGKNYWLGSGSPVSIDSYLKDLRHRLNHQYELTFASHQRAKQQIASLKLSASDTDAKVVAPDKVFLSGFGAGSGD